MDDELSSLVDALPGLLWTARHDAYVDFVNRRWCEYTGVTAAEALGQGWLASIHPDDLPLVRDRWPSGAAGDRATELELRLRRFDGQYRWFSLRISAVTDAHGRVVKWCGLNSDIDERKRAEQDLHIIVNTIQVLAWTALPDGLADFFNQHYLDYLGITQEQARGTGWAGAVHPDDLPGLLATWQRILASEKLGETEARLRRFDGEYRWFLFRASPLHDEAGSIVKWYGVNTDIDDRKRAEGELRRSEAFLAEGERLNLTGSFCWCPDTDELSFSEQYVRIFEFEPGEPLTPEKIAGRVHPDDLLLLSEKVALARQGISDHGYELRLRMPDGSIKYLRTNSYGTRTRDGRLEFIGAIQDVTERRLSEQALSRVRSELAYMTRVASLGALTASIAHEVNQPLSGIITNANTCLRMLASEPPNVDGARETARRTIRDGNRASGVIARLRALFSRREVAAELVDLNEATREVIALSASELQRARVIVRTELAEDLPLALGDRVQLQQVILNLLVNASAAMSGVRDRPRQLSVRTEREDADQVRLTVRDTGIGLEPETVEQLFEPFYTTKSNGMGVGLSVSRSIVESHGGRLWAEPNDGPGARFSFSIPRAPSPAANAYVPGAIPTRRATEPARPARTP